MDGDRFDTLARSLHARSRRRFLGSLSGLALAGALAPVLGLADAQAKKKRKKKKGKKGEPRNPCANGVQDGDETDIDCGGSCGPCANEQRCINFIDCQSGVCAPNGTCQSCTDLAGECPSDRHGACSCGTGLFGVPEGVCASTDASNAATCDVCPPDSIGCFRTLCRHRCGTI